MDQNYQNYHDTGEVPNPLLENLDKETLNIGIIVGGVLFSTGFLGTLSLPTYEKAVYEDYSKIETPPPTYHDLFFWTIPIFTMKSISQK